MEICYNTWGKVSGDCNFPDAEVMYQLDKEKGNKVINVMPEWKRRRLWNIYQMYRQNR